MILTALVAGLIRLFCIGHVRYAACAADGRPRVYFANHSSLFDYLVIWAVLPAELRRRVRPAAARDYWTANAVRRFFAVRIFRAKLIERRRPTCSNNPLAEMLDAIDHGESLIIFPEGTRDGGCEVRCFQAGLYHLCKARPGLEAVPVHLENLHRVLPKGEFLPLPLLAGVRFGAPFTLDTCEPRPDFLARARDAVLALGGDPR